MYTYTYIHTYTQYVEIFASACMYVLEYHWGVYIFEYVCKYIFMYMYLCLLCVGLGCLSLDAVGFCGSSGNGSAAASLGSADWCH